MYLKDYNNLEVHLNSQSAVKALLKFYLCLSLYDTLNNFLCSKSLLPRSQQIYIPNMSGKYLQIYNSGRLLNFVLKSHTKKIISIVKDTEIETEFP